MGTGLTAVSYPSRLLSEAKQKPSDGLVVAERLKDASFPPPCASGRNLHLVGCTMNIGLRAWRRDSDEVFGASQGNCVF